MLVERFSNSMTAKKSVATSHPIHSWASWWERSIDKSMAKLNTSMTPINYTQKLTSVTWKRRHRNILKAILHREAKWLVKLAVIIADTLISIMLDIGMIEKLKKYGKNITQYPQTKCYHQTQFLELMLWLWSRTTLREPKKKKKE